MANAEKFMEGIGKCERCGALCKSGIPGEDARLLRRSDSGICANCALTKFLKGIPIGRTIEPAMLYNSMVQQKIEDILEEGNADLKISEINWDAVVKNWNL